MHRFSRCVRLSLLCVLAPMAACSDDGSATSTGENESSSEGGITLTMTSADTGTSADTSTSMSSMSNTGMDTTTGVDSSSGGGPASCTDMIHNGDETDVDCGGSCDACGPGDDCMVPEDCMDLVCNSGECQAATCFDDVQNGTEEDVDCGPDCPNECGVVIECEDDGDCDANEFCDIPTNTCVPEDCGDMMLNGDETDVDCGGPDCVACPPGGICDDGNDCESLVCDPMDMLCDDVSCMDMVQNGDETDEDCGGSCNPCANSLECNVGADCISGVCSNFGQCSAPTCFDTVMNGTETDEDCGGTCLANCVVGEGCLMGNDCTTNVCAGNVCADAMCGDMVQNGDETDVDCGGMCGASCEPGEDCDGSGDCVQGVCEFGLCSAPDCSDNVQNGDETDQDCGGMCGATCIPGEDCVDGGDCVQGVCEGMVCSPADCFDNVENGDETDLDCGGACGATCDPGEGCDDANDCVEGVCTLFTCAGPSCNDNVQNGTEGGVDCQGSCPNPCGGGQVVVNTTLADLQLQPAISASPNGNRVVVVWTSAPSAMPAQDGSGTGVFGQIYQANGTAFGNEFQVNTYTMLDQGFADVSVYDTGFIVVWQSNGQDTDSFGVYAQRYDSNGNTVGNEFKVNTTNTDQQRRPSVATDSNGAAVVCWDSDQGLTFEVYCQRYTSLGAATGVETQINMTTTGDQQLPVVGRAGAGAYTVVWQSSNAQDTDGIGVFQRRFDNAGGALTNETQVNTYTTLNQSQPAIAMNSTGEYAITWTSDGQDGNSTGVYAKLFTSAGVLVGAEFRANTFTTGAQDNPAVGINADGDFMIAWQSVNQDTNQTGVFAQRYSQAGATVGVEFQVNTTFIGFQEEPDVTIRGEQEPTVVWSSGSITNRDIHLERFEGEFP